MKKKSGLSDFGTAVFESSMSFSRGVITLLRLKELGVPTKKSLMYYQVLISTAILLSLYFISASV